MLCNNGNWERYTYNVVHKNLYYKKWLKDNLVCMCLYCTMYIT